MASNHIAKPQSLRSLLSQSPELQQAARQLASLALDHLEQNGQLRVRQREQLRRALAATGDARGWTGVSADSGDSTVEPSKDVLAMAKNGAKALAQDVAHDLDRKRTEVDRLSDAATAARNLSEDAEATYPGEIPYSYTVRDASQGLATKTDTLTPNDAREALSGAEALQRSIPGRTKLADLMVLDLEQRQVKIEVMARTLPDFVKSSQGILLEVLANLQ